jgi:inosine/xanthosine triphosphate pyrophosphatase family protein
MPLPSKILIGTRNQAKIDMIKSTFPNVGIELLSLNDVAPIDDSELVEGMDFVENSKVKSKFYFEKTDIPTISTDQVQWLENWPDNNGLIMHIRKLVNPNAVRTSDEEVIEWIKSFVAKYGPSKAIFHFGVGYTDENGTKGFDVTQREYILQGERSETVREEYVFDQFMKDPETGEYRVDQPDSVAYDHLAKFWNDVFIQEISK